MQLNTSMGKKIVPMGQTHTVHCGCGHKYEIDALQEGEVREITCPNCKVKRRIGKMQIGKLD